MTGLVVVLDAGVLDRAGSNKEFRWVLHELVARGWDPVVPAVVLAEAVTGRPTDAPVNQVVTRLGTVVTTEPTACLAGHLRFRVGRASGRMIPSGIDAIVASHAAQAGHGVVFTTDPSDLQLLLADHPQVMVDTPQGQPLRLTWRAVPSPL